MTFQFVGSILHMLLSAFSSWPKLGLGFTTHTFLALDSFLWNTWQILFKPWVKAAFEMEDIGITIKDQQVSCYERPVKVSRWDHQRATYQSFEESRVILFIITREDMQHTKYSCKKMIYCRQSYNFPDQTFMQSKLLAALSLLYFNRWRTCLILRANC